MKTIKIIIDNEEIKTIKVNDQDIDILMKIIEVFKAPLIIEGMERLK